MAVIVEGFSVVVRNEALERKFPGGFKAYAGQPPNNTFCADDKICRVGFMTEIDARAFVERLVMAGLDGPRDGKSPDLAIVASSSATPDALCDWLELEVRWCSKDGQPHGVTTAKLRGEDSREVAMPVNWRLSSIVTVSRDDLAVNYELVTTHRRDGGAVEEYRHRQTGEAVYIGRPDVLRVQERYRELLNEYGSIEGLQGQKQRDAATAFLNRATQLVKDTNEKEPGPLLIQGMAARLLARWDLAEESFRAVTILQPTFLAAWHDLTWALASLGRLEEAESTARETITRSLDDPASLGNLASVLRERGKLDEALQTIRRALELKAGDRINEAILDQIRKDQGVPWYKRLFVN